MTHNIRVVRQSLGMAIENIRSNKVRSFLTMLGIIIGVGSVIAMITITNSAASAVMGGFASLGSTALTVSIQATDLKPGMTEMDLDTIRALDGVVNVAPSVAAYASARYDDVTKKEVEVLGMAPMAIGRGSVKVTEGRPFTTAESDGQMNVCLVDSIFIKKVMKGNSPVGKEVYIGGMKYRVIGIVYDSENEYAYIYNYGDGSVYIPYTNAMRMNDTGVITRFGIFVEEGYSDAVVEQKIRTTLTKMFNNNKKAYTITNMAALRRMEEETTKLLSALTGGIASIALIVGGIGIMNMMLVSVTERTKEIGLRKALGAEPKRIQAQFLIESVVLSVFGGTIGIIFGLAVAFVATKLMDVKFDLSIGAIIIGFGFSTAVGVVFGWAPAKRASELNPIDALRTE